MKVESEVKAGMVLCYHETLDASEVCFEAYSDDWLTNLMTGWEIRPSDSFA